MNNEYVIINKTELLKEIEELEKALTHHNEWYKKARENYDRDKKFWGHADDGGEMRVASDAVIETSQEIRILKQTLSKSTPLIPEIEKAFDAGRTVENYKGERKEVYHDDMTSAKYEESKDYILNLKLDI